MFFFFCQTALH